MEDLRSRLKVESLPPKSKVNSRQSVKKAELASDRDYTNTHASVDAPERAVATGLMSSTLSIKVKSEVGRTLPFRRSCREGICGSGLPTAAGR